MKRKIWLIIGGTVLAVMLIIAGASFFVHKGAGVLDVETFVAQADSLQGRFVTIKGRVAAGSVSFNDKTGATEFALADGGENLPVLYRGVLPDSFRPGAEIEAQGSYGADGVFQARSFGKPASLCTICHS